MSKFIDDEKTILKDDKCILCGNVVEGGEILVDGSVYHLSCYERILNKNSEIEERLEATRLKLSQKTISLDETQKLLRKSKSIVNSFKASFGLTHIQGELCVEKITLLNTEIEETKSQISAINEGRQKNCDRLRPLYDFWPAYPPDWDNRTKELKEEQGGCEVCGDEYRLHVHHRINIKDGGNHKEENLVVLCENCHGEIHNEDFSEKQFVFDKKISAFAKKLEILNFAMSNDKNIVFNYTKYDGEKSRRTIQPKFLKRVGHSLCVSGFCYLRDDNRTFAIRRMRNIELVDS